MGSMRPAGRFIPFPNNIQRTQKQPVPAGFAQSLSGSETDISTSNENLSNEERYVIRHTARVEPQGQENQQTNRNTIKETNSNRNSLKESINGANNIGGTNSNRSSLDVSTSSYNTLIIHNAGQDDSWTGRLSSLHTHTPDLNHSSNQSSPYHTLINQDSKKPSGIPLPISKEQPRNNQSYIDVGTQRIFNGAQEHGMQEITEIPDDFLNQSSVLKHLAKEVAASPVSSTPPSPSRRISVSEGRSDYSRKSSKTLGGHLKGKLSREKLSLSRSQPDLSSVGSRAIPGASDGGAWSSEDEESALQALLADNARLKSQLQRATQTQLNAHKLEAEVGAVHAAHEELVGACERRERLERAARARLQSDCRRLHDLNRALREQVELLTSQLMRSTEPVSTSAESLKKELQNREMLIAQLITQNKELACSKERQEIELAAQRATLQEQRTHIDILDTALTNAQANVVRLEEECRAARTRGAQLQRAAGAVQAAADRRDATERALRLQLEAELNALRKRECSNTIGGNTNESNGKNTSSVDSELLRARDDRILALEAECALWQQRYMNAAPISEEARIAAMERSSAETERLMAEARAEKIRHMDELHLSQKRVADLEGRVKELESKVAEREAMIKVLQKHNTSGAYDSTTSLRNNNSREELVGFGASSAASFSSAEGSRYRQMLTRHNYGTNTPASSSGSNYDSRLDEQLAALESRFERATAANNNRGLCCFPAFSAGTTPRKGKIEQGFLGSLVPREPPSNRPEEMLLLEKQGRTSQQQRAGSLPPPPPSSLPRPPRRPSASRLPSYGRLERRDPSESPSASPQRSLLPAPRRLGEYDRLRSKTSARTSDSRETLVRGDSSPRDSYRAGSNSSRESLVRGASNARDSAGSAGTSSSLPSPSKLAMYASNKTRRASSLNKENKTTEGSVNKYRIRF